MSRMLRILVGACASVLLVSVAQAEPEKCQATIIKQMAKLKKQVLKEIGQGKATPLDLDQL